MLIDLSHTIEHGMITYAGLPPPVISDFLTREASRPRYAEGTEFQIARMEMVANTAPFDVSHHPAMAVPCGMSDGLPVSMMLVGRHFDEPTMFRVADAYQRSTR